MYFFVIWVNWRFKLAYFHVIYNSRTLLTGVSNEYVKKMTWSQLKHVASWLAKCALLSYADKNTGQLSSFRFTLAIQTRRCHGDTGHFKHLYILFLLLLFERLVSREAQQLTQLLIYPYSMRTTPSSHPTTEQRPSGWWGNGFEETNT